MKESQESNESHSIQRDLSNKWILQPSNTGSRQILILNFKHCLKFITKRKQKTRKGYYWRILGHRQPMNGQKNHGPYFRFRHLNTMQGILCCYWFYLTSGPAVSFTVSHEVNPIFCFFSRHQRMCAQMAPYSLHSALRLTRALWKPIPYIVHYI